MTTAPNQLLHDGNEDQETDHADNAEDARDSRLVGEEATLECELGYPR